MSGEYEGVLYERVSEMPLKVKSLASEAWESEFESQNHWWMVRVPLDLYTCTVAYISLHEWVYTDMHTKSHTHYTNTYKTHKNN